MKGARTNDRSNRYSLKGSLMCPRLHHMLIFFHGGFVPIFDVVSSQVQRELSFVVASLSFYSALVSVDPFVAVRVMLD